MEILSQIAWIIVYVVGSLIVGWFLFKVACRIKRKITLYRMAIKLAKSDDPSARKIATSLKKYAKQIPITKYEED